MEDGQLAAGELMHLSDDDFGAKVLKSECPVLVDFWASWCVPCKMIAPVLAEIAKEHAGKLTIGKMDVDANQGTAIRYGVQSIPTLILFKSGQEVARLVGFFPKKDILTELKLHLDLG